MWPRAVVSLFELFKIGIGPSSSHTIGPMRAALTFASALTQPERTARLRTDLFGSLAWTGKGHATDKAVMLGLAGHAPDQVDPDAADAAVVHIGETGRLMLDGRFGVAFDRERDIVFDRLTAAPVHPNTLAFTALDDTGAVLATERWCSVGGGFIVREQEAATVSLKGPAVPHPFASGDELLALTRRTGLSIAELVFSNECALRPREAVLAHLDRIIETMMACIDRGLVQQGELPGRLRVRRRAAAMLARLEADRFRNLRNPHEVMDHVSLFAIAVNEENASGGRVVTAPTNGAAGVIPAVLRYYRDFCANATPAGMHDILLVAAAIGALFKMNASISGAEVGCQGEVGVACSMAAAGLAAALGATAMQVENAAEIGMEHHLGMTCDPIGGLVQIPCIERNAFGATKAINAASLALRGDGSHHVSLDQVIATMRRTGADMSVKYKETSLGGLAVSFPEC